MKDSSLPANFLEATNPAIGFGSTRRSALNWKEPCLEPCLTCGTAAKEDCHPQDTRLLLAAQNKLKYGTQPKTGAGGKCFRVFSRCRNRRYQDSPPETGLSDKRLPLQDENPRKLLLNSIRGYQFSEHSYRTSNTRRGCTSYDYRRGRNTIPSVVQN